MYILSDCDLLSTDRYRKVHCEIPADEPGVSNLLEMGGLVADTISSVLGLVGNSDPESPRDFRNVFQ